MSKDDIETALHRIQRWVIGFNLVLGGLACLFIAFSLYRMVLWYQYRNSLPAFGDIGYKLMCVGLLLLLLNYRLLMRCYQLRRRLQRELIELSADENETPHQ